MSLNNKILSDITVHMKYAKFIPGLQRRETWDELVNRGQKKVLPIKYTPDFVSDSFIIECKGRANESFPIRWKMFKKYVKEHLKHVTLYKPQNQKECDLVIELITKKIK